MARTPFIVGNWKMHLTIRGAEQLASGLRQRLDRLQGVDIGVCPPFLSLPAVASMLRGSSVRLGAQNCHWKTGGPFTGEVAAPMLKDVGCRHVILGHSERRHIFGESDSIVNAKVLTALECDLEPIICVGETLEQRRAERTKQVVGSQLLAAVENVTPEQMKRITLAYEPVWAIGTGETATPEQAQEVHAFLREQIVERCGAGIAEALRIQYGGSVKPENASRLLEQPDIDGGLIGGASLAADSFAAIVNAALA